MEEGGRTYREGKRRGDIFNSHPPSLGSAITSSEQPFSARAVVPTMCQGAEDTVLSQTRIWNPPALRVDACGQEMIVCPSRLSVPSGQGSILLIRA